MWKKFDSKLTCCYGSAWKNEKGDIIIYDGGWRWKLHCYRKDVYCEQYCARDSKEAQERADFYIEYGKWI